MKRLLSYGVLPTVNHNLIIIQDIIDYLTKKNPFIESTPLRESTPQGLLFLNYHRKTIMALFKRYRKAKHTTEQTTIFLNKIRCMCYNKKKSIQNSS